jgi:hypothetical protein
VTIGPFGGGFPADMSSLIARIANPTQNSLPWCNILWRIYNMSFAFETFTISDEL